MLDARQEGLEAPRQQVLQGCRACYGPEGSANHQEPYFEAPKEAPGLECGTLRGVKASGTNFLQVAPLPQLSFEDDTYSFSHQAF